MTSAICSFGQGSITIGTQGSPKGKSQVFVLAVDTLILPLTTKVKFIRIGDRVFELTIDTNLKLVNPSSIFYIPDIEPLKIDLHGSILGAATTNCNLCVPAGATKSTPPPHFIKTK